MLIHCIVTRTQYAKAWVQPRTASGLRRGQRTSSPGCYTSRCFFYHCYCCVSSPRESAYHLGPSCWLIFLEKTLAVATRLPPFQAPEGCSPELHSRSQRQDCLAVKCIRLLQQDNGHHGKGLQIDSSKPSFGDPFRDLRIRLHWLLDDLQLGYATEILFELLQHTRNHQCTSHRSCRRRGQTTILSICSQQKDPLRDTPSNQQDKMRTPRPRPLSRYWSASQL